MATKKTRVVSGCFILLAFFLSSCAADDNAMITPSKGQTDDSPLSQVSTEVLTSLETKYPNAENIQWSTNSNYYVANFKESGTSVQAWFTSQGKWTLSKTGVSVGNLEPSITDAVENSSYADYNIVTANRLDRNNTSSIYVLSLTGDDGSLNLYLSKAGDIIKSKNVSYVDTPLEIPQAVNNTIASMYSDYEILDIWDSMGYKYVGITSSNDYKLITLDSAYEWNSTMWDITTDEVPTTVLNRFQSSSYGKYILDRIMAMQSGEGVSYIFYFEQDEKQKYAVLRENTNSIAVITPTQTI